MSNTNNNWVVCTTICRRTQLTTTWGDSSTWTVSSMRRCACFRLWPCECCSLSSYFQPCVLFYSHVHICPRVFFLLTPKIKQAPASLLTQRFPCSQGPRLPLYCLYEESKKQTREQVGVGCVFVSELFSSEYTGITIV